jgi:hypothetical protein
VKKEKQEELTVIMETTKRQRQEEMTVQEEQLKGKDKRMRKSQ